MKATTLNKQCGPEWFDYLKSPCQYLCVLWTNLYPNHSKPTFSCVCVGSRCMFSVDVREAGWFCAHGMITQIQKQLLSDGSVKIDGSTN